MKRAYSVNNVMRTSFSTMGFDGTWADVCGEPEMMGSWFIYGAPKNGKTSFAMQLSKYLTKFGRVAYNSIEEGLSKSIKDAMERVNMTEIGRKLILLDKENVDDMMLRLKKHKSPDIIIIDSVQFLELKFSEYKSLKNNFPNKLFIYISHVEGKLPDGITARKIWRDANISFRIEGFKAFPVGRYGGGREYIINNNRALEYWGFEAQNGNN